MSFKRIALGKRGEEIAEKFLRNKGYDVIERNYRCSIGEIDIICINDNKLVFVEVRSRSTNNYGLPEESINFTKKKKIRAVALHFLQSQNRLIKEIQFDVIAIRFSKEGAIESLEHYENAF